MRCEGDDALRRLLNFCFMAIIAKRQPQRGLQGMPGKDRGA